MKKNDWILILSVAAYSGLFYNQYPGINCLVFSIVLLFLLVWRNPAVLRDNHWYAAASGTIVTAACVALFGTALSVFAHLISLGLLSALSISKKSSVILAGVYALISLLTSPLFMLIDLIERRKGGSVPKGRTWIGIGMTLFIIAITIIFFRLYQKSNPLFMDFTRKINLDFISWPWVFFTLGGFILMYGFFYHRNLPSWLKWDVSRPTRLCEEDLQQRGNTFMGKKVNVKWEIQSGLILLIVLNILLLTMNTLDLYFMWITQSLPSGMNYAEYVHQGTGTMIVSIVMAIMIVLFFFRGHINFDKGNKVLRIFAILWLVQNMIAVASTAYRNSLYVQEYSLTYLRIGVYLFLALTLIGLVTTLVKILAAKSNWYLFRANGWAVYIVLVLFACQNWDLVIARFNIQQSKNPDRYYLLSLDSPAVLPELLKLSPETTDSLMYSSKTEYLISTMGRQWGDTDYFNEEIDRRVNNFLDEYEQKGWRSWNRQDQQTAAALLELYD